MVALIDKSREKCSLTVNEEFEKYLIEQRSSTTYNGLELAEFSWYMKKLGLKS